MNARFRSLPIWPHPATPARERRSRYTFKAPWSSTLELLERELRLLEAKNIVIGCGLREQDIRLDGWPRSNALVPAHPGVEVSFDTRHGRLVYATDVCEIWEHNVRAVGLGLEALRAVDRHGITRRGEQYAGFKAIASGSMDGNAEHGRELIARAGSVRAALHAAHPDHGGSDADFRDVQAAREEGAQ